MPDRLFLSCWVRGFDSGNMLKHLEALLRVFPYSKLAARGPVLRVRAVEMSEPPLLEREFPRDSGREVARDIVTQAREFAHEDCCIEVDASWDLWQYEGEWKLGPSPVTLLCFAPEFENDTGDHLRVEFGLDQRFLPIEGVEGSIRMGQSNLRSLLHLVTDIEHALPIAGRRLWSESGINFAELLAEAVAKIDVQ